MFTTEPISLKRQLTEGNIMSHSPSPKVSDTVDVLMIGTGEYTTGYVNGSKSDSDKGAGVVALTMVDLRRRGKVGRIGLCGTNGSKLPEIRSHMDRCIKQNYKDMDLTMEYWPTDENTVKRDAYKGAIDSFEPGDCCTIFTPDDTHFTIALYAINHGLHTIVTKPIVKTLDEHMKLYEAAKRAGVLVMVEVHKRFDPIYVDARDRIKNMGEFGYMYSYMSQPKHQLDTFRVWAGKGSDISYYLNSHHVDFHEWAMLGKSRPIRVTGTCSNGVALKKDICTEDTITLTVQWKNLKDGSLGLAVYTSSWVAPKSDVHSQQRFFYMGHKGEINVDQAHRGYTLSTDDDGYKSVNPLFMKYTPTNGYFSGQNGYGYKSFESFVDAVNKINSNLSLVEDFDSDLATINTTFMTTAILEAGRLSLDNDSIPYSIIYDGPNEHMPTKLIPAFQK